MSDYENDEIDDFNANQEKILLEEAGNYGRASEDDESSEEEVMGVDEDSDEDDEGAENDDDDEDEDEEEEDGEGDDSDDEKNWGGRKNYYGGENEEDEDVKLMTEEALKQQKKHLQDLAMDDFVDEELMEDWKKKEEADEQETGDIGTKISIALGSSDATKNLSSKDKLQLLNQQFPEFVPLVGELKTLQPVLQELRANEGKSEVTEVKTVALSAYLAAITSYFAIFMDSITNDESFSTMKENPVMESILSAKEVWRQASEISEGGVTEVEVEDSDADSAMEEDGAELEQFSEEDEDEELDEDEREEEEEDESAEAVSRDTVPDITVKRTRAKTTRPGAKFGDYSESSTPHDVDLEDKTRRKKTLRFYTSRIDQASAKNSERFAGDLDLPYKERLFERQQRLVEEARKRGLAEKDQLGGGDDDGADDFGDDFTAEDERVAQEVNRASEDDYYNTIKQGKSDKKASRKLAHEEAVKAAKEGKLAEAQELLGEDGKRAVNFQILKNKGLTPHRNKDNRNSRVKKRKKYEKAQKKLKSVRQVYDDSNRGPYEGEKTGIKKGITRSVKLV